MNPLLIVVGLGNPGASYEHTRHNTGFRAVDFLSGEFGEGEWKRKDKFQSDVREGRIITIQVLFVRPQTYMNLSGNAVRKLVDFYHVNPREQLLVICDDVDIPLGEIRLKEKGSGGTHNGLKSIVGVLGEEFPRLRIGIGPAPSNQDLSAWVLSRFSDEEEKKLEGVLKEVPQKVRKFVLEENPKSDSSRRRPEPKSEIRNPKQ